MKKREFTESQVEWIRENIKHMSTRKCAEEFSKAFNLPLGQTELRRVMARNEIKASVRRNEFLPIGTEKWNDYYQCIIVKTGDYHCQKGVDRKQRDIQRNKNWTFKQNLVWEQATGKKLGWREVVIFLDGDRTNYSPENLYAVPLNVAGTIEKMRMHSEDKDIYKTALIWGELYYEVKRTGRMVIVE